MTTITTVKVYDFKATNGEVMMVSIIDANWSGDKIVVRSWNGKATPSGWKSSTEWDGHRFLTTKDQLTNPRMLSLFVDGSLEAKKEK